MYLKKVNLLMLGLVLGLISCSVNHKTEQPLRLWYDQPANSTVADVKEGWVNDPEWLKALPVGRFAGQR